MTVESAAERLDARLRQARDRLDALESGVGEAAGRPAGSPQPFMPSEAQGHVLFVPTPGGYEIVARRGTPPSPGDVVSLAERDEVFVAAKVADSPLPGDSRPCVYLVAA